MSLHLPSRRVLTASRLSSLVPALQSLSLAPPLATPQRRHASFGKKRSGPSASPSAKANRLSMDKDAGSSTLASRRKLLENLKASGIEGDSIFDDELSASSQRRAGGKIAPPGPLTDTGASLLRDHHARATDPDPLSRVRWLRKMVARHVANSTNPFSREPRAARIARTERQLLSRSTSLPTSVKKLVHLARQVQGKTLADAIIQMRYSKKKMAAEVLYQLNVALDRAVAERGMGAGGQLVNPDGSPVDIRTKDGKWVSVTDPTRMYVSEAWVGRGWWRGIHPEYRARGKVNLLRKPSTSISIVLKEEKTRIREYQEREAKKHRQGPWVHLPDRPVTAQRQYYSW